MNSSSKLLFRNREYIPKLFFCLRHYSTENFVKDLISGVTVGFIALPLAMAFAISSGVEPQAGIYCGIVAGLVCGVLGGSRYQVSGPTGAFVVVVSGIVAKYGIDGLFTCTFMAGVMLLLLGAFKLGSVVKYMPRPVIIGFTNGIGVLIASTQIKDFLGLKIEHVPGDFIGRMVAVAENIGTISFSTLLIGLLSLAGLIELTRRKSKIPPTIAVLLVATFVSWIFGFLFEIETIQTRFGEIPQTFPPFRVPALNPQLMLSLLSPAIAIALLGAVESLLSAVVSDRMSNDRHNPNMELIAQGAANVISPFFGGIPVTGAIARTAANIRAGAFSPVSTIIHALTLIAIVFIAAPLAKHIPLCLLSAILFLVSYNMGEWHEIPKILKLTGADIAVWFITFGLTVFADLAVAVEAGLILAAMLYVRRVTSTTTISEITNAQLGDHEEHTLAGKEIPPGTALFHIHGPFLFGASDKLSVIRENIQALPPVVILRLRDMTAIDGTGIGALEDLAVTLRNSGKNLIVCGMRGQPLHLMEQTEFKEMIGVENLCRNISAALDRARTILAAGKEAQLAAPPLPDRLH